MARWADRRWRARRGPSTHFTHFAHCTHFTHFTHCTHFTPFTPFTHFTRVSIPHRLVAQGRGVRQSAVVEASGRGALRSDPAAARAPGRGGADAREERVRSRGDGGGGSAAQLCPGRFHPQL
eukprot:COSAG02_NODE_22235_length_759_cov_0.646970_1_plen_121_part_10